MIRIFLFLAPGLLLVVTSPAAAQAQREEAIRSTQADIEKYPFADDEILLRQSFDDGKKRWSMLRVIGRARTVGRCRTEFVTPEILEKTNIEPDASYVVDWGTLRAVTQARHLVAISGKNPALKVTFEATDAVQAKNFAEVFDYLRQACS